MATPIAGGSDTTPPTPPSSATATAVGSGRIDVTWTASTDNVGVTEYRVERCQGSGCSGFAQVATVTGTSYDDTGLLSGTSYSYRVRAADNAGNLSGYSNVVTAITESQASGLVAAYAFDEGAGSVVADASGNGHTGTISGATWIAAGRYNRGLDFNGTNALVTIGDAAKLDLTTGMTLAAWVYPPRPLRTGAPSS
jgi:chitodextrinase